MAGLSVQSLSKSWNDTVVVNDVSFDIAHGEFVALLGPSGCGKSTTLRLIAGLEEASSGHILIDGRDVTTLPPSQRRIAMVFQSYALFPHLTVEQNIVFGLSVRGVARVQRKQKLDRVVPLLGLEKLLDRRPAQLSGGQQQRVALGRALIAEAPVCLLDEPLSNLDAKLRAEMRTEIRDLQKRLGITMIFVTHDQTEAMSMADRVIVMRDGRVEQFDSPARLYRDPASLFVAGFIGAPPMNVIDPAALGSLADQVGSDLVGVRPENIRLVPEGLPATIVGIEYFGADSIVSAKIGAARLSVRLSGKPAIAVGDNLHVGWSPEDVHRFDPATGLRRDNRGEFLSVG